MHATPRFLLLQRSSLHTKPSPHTNLRRGSITSHGRASARAPSAPAQPQHLRPSGPARAPTAQPPRATAAFAGVASAPEVLYRPSLSRRTTDPLPPLGSKITGLLKLGDGHWCLRQDLILTENIFLNTHVLRLRSGALMLINPPSPTEEAVALLNSIAQEEGASAAATGTGGGGGGRKVEHVVLPNLSPEHWYSAADWAPHLAPNATLWTVPGLLQGRSTASMLGGPERVRQMRAVYDRVVEMPDFGALPGLEEEVEVATFHESGGRFSESVLWLRDHRAAVFADMAFAAYDHPRNNWLELESAKLAGLYRRLGCPLVYLMFRSEPRVARAWLERVLMWDVDRVLASHLDPQVTNGAAEIRRCFGFLLEQA